MTTVTQLQQAVNLFGDPVYFSPDATDPEPHAGFCVDCGSPAPLVRVYDGYTHRLCIDTVACRGRIEEQASMHMDQEYERRYVLTANGKQAVAS